jgi:class 3 adenylate cyclase/tetratricopeptide (TPR) repeat protein
MGFSAMQCPRCMQDNPAHAKFCLECGIRFTAPSRFGPPRGYTPTYLAERILTSRRTLEGERKQVTVLFADLKGSMELLGDRDVEEARKLLDAVVERMIEAVHRYEGTVNLVMGDGIMALFGAPLAHEDHAARACYAALRMQERIARYAEELRRTEGVDVQIRVGINSGEVVVRSVSGDLHMEYTALGQTTHLASRLERLARPGATFMTAHTLALADGQVEVRPLGPFAIRGLAESVQVYELMGAAPARTRLQTAAVRGLSRFVGREAEMGTLDRALERGIGGDPQIVAVVGEPGVGKSRLLYEFTRVAHRRGCSVLEASAVSHGQSTAYLPLAQLLRSYFTLGVRDGPAVIREKVARRVVTVDPGLEDTVPPILALLEALPDESAFLTLPPSARRQRTFGALTHLLVRESRGRPFILVLEDLQWIDPGTQAFLDRLVEGVTGERILILVTYRPEHRHEWAGRPGYTELSLGSLPSGHARRLLDALIGPEPALDRLKARLIERTDGNPFFLEESVRMLVETGALAGSRGGYALARALDNFQVPASVRAILAARIDRLGSDEKRLLQAAAVVGKDVAFALMQAVTDLPEDAVRRSVSRVLSADFLYESSLFPDVEYGFRHALTHEVVYDGLLQDHRRALHARIVDAIEALYPERLSEHVDQLGHHAFRGELWAKAATYLRQAGTKAQLRSANREAVACFEQALAALQQLPQTPASREAAIDVRVDLRNSLFALGELERVAGHLDQAEALARRLGDRRRLGLVLALLTNCSFVTGRIEQAVVSGQQTLAIADELGDFGLQAVARCYLAQAYSGLGEYQRAVLLSRENVDRLGGTLRVERFGMPAPAAVLARSFLVRALVELGEFTEAIVHAKAAAAIAEEADQAFSLVNAYYDAGFLCLRKGELRDALARLERASDLCRRADLPLLAPQVNAALGYGYALSGRTDEGLGLLEQAVAESVSVRRMPGHSSWIAWFGEACLAAGRTDAAARLAGRALDTARAHRRRGHEAWALRLLAALHAHPESLDLESAESSFRQAIVLANELGMRPLIAHCRLGLGRAYRLAGKRQQANEQLRSAMMLFRALDMRFWLVRTEIEAKEMR